MVESASNLDDFDRSFIARSILWVYAVSILTVFVFLAAEAVKTSSDWKTAVSNADDVIKTSVVPIVTLVLGYYFGKSKN